MGQHLCPQLFRRPNAAELSGFRPNFTIINVPSFLADPETEGTRSTTAAMKRMEVIIVGTSTPARSKSAFTVMNYLMPAEGVLPMHSGGQRGRGERLGHLLRALRDGQDDALRRSAALLIGDDEHGWGNDGVFNFEGGCYAKTIRLSPMYEPDIFATTKRFGTIWRTSTSTRALAPWTWTAIRSPRTRAPPTAASSAMPRRPAWPAIACNVVFLTADAFGVLPPISRLDRAQAEYHFISGYTAKLAGTEVGIKEPKAFSAGFGAVPATPPAGVRVHARRAARPVPGAGVAGEHRVDGRPVRHRRADEHQPHPLDGAPP